MIQYALRRLAGAVPLVLGIATIIFFLINLAPGDPTLLLLPRGVTQEVLQQMRENFGLDQPVHIRYLKWLGAMLTGDFGYSFSHSRPVADVILDFLPNTLLLSACALLLAFFFGIVLGTIQAVRQYSATDSVLSVVLLFFYSMPSFWLALMLILTMSLYARNVWELPLWFPASGIASTDGWSALKAVSSMSGPAASSWLMFTFSSSAARPITAIPEAPRFMRSVYQIAFAAGVSSWKSWSSLRTV